MRQTQANAREDADWQRNAASNMFTFPYFAPPGGAPDAPYLSSTPPPPPLMSAGTPVMQALADGHQWPIQTYLQATASPVLPVHVEPAWRPRTAPAELIAAACVGDLPTMARLLANPAIRENINVEDDSGKSALDHALERKSFSAARLLTQHGARFADDDLQNSQLLADLIGADEMALARDVARSRQRLVARLNAPPPREPLGTQTPLTMAILIGDVELVSLLMDSQSLTLRDGVGNSLLHFAVAALNPRMLPALLACLPADPLQRQALLNAARTDGRTPLVQAVVSNRPTAMAVLLRAGAAIDALDLKAETALHKAARDGLLEIGRLLLAMGARTDLRNRRQQTPMAVAREQGRPDFVQLLEAFGVRD